MATFPAPARALALALLAAGCAFARPEPKSQALLLMSKGQTAQAEQVLLGFLREHPAALAERRLLARVYASEGQLGKAQEQIEILARQLGASSPIPYVELGSALELAHRFDEALEQYDRAAEVAPSDPLGPLTGGMRAAHWGELELAEPRLREAARRAPKSASTWHALGLVRAKLGNLADARQAYQFGLLADPDALENHIGLATLALVEHQPADALKHYDAVAAARPSFADAELGRAFALLELRRFADAEAALERAERLGANRRAVQAQRARLSEARSAPPGETRSVSPSEAPPAPPSEAPPAPKPKAESESEKLNENQSLPLVTP